MASPINNNSNTPGATNATSAQVGVDGVDPLASPSINIPNDGANYHWFLPNITGSRLTISPSDMSNSNIRSNMSIKAMVSHILGRIGDRPD